MENRRRVVKFSEINVQMRIYFQNEDKLTDNYTEGIQNDEGVEVGSHRITTHGNAFREIF